MHTPGPWKACFPDQAKLGLGFNIIAADHTVVAHMNYIDTWRHGRKETGKAEIEARKAELLANARLVAAAPAMLEALKSLVDLAAAGQLASEETLALARLAFTSAMSEG